MIYTFKETTVYLDIKREANSRGRISFQAYSYAYSQASAGERERERGEREHSRVGSQGESYLPIT